MVNKISQAAAGKPRHIVTIEEVNSSQTTKLTKSTRHNRGVNTRNSAIADKPARRVYQSRSPNIVPFHMLDIPGSFLLCNCNFVFKTRRFYDIPLQKCRDLEIGVRGHSRSLKVAFNRLCMVSYYVVIMPVGTTFL